MAEDSDFVTCNQCGHSVPRMRVLHPLRPSRLTTSTAANGSGVRARFAANPGEPVRAIALTSTLFPQLPRADMHMFRNALMLGVALVIVLAIVGAFPLAVSTAAVLVPLLMVLYLWDVDVYEDEPRTVLGATMLWGAVMGASAPY